MQPERKIRKPKFKVGQVVGVRWQRGWMFGKIFKISPNNGPPLKPTAPALLLSERLGIGTNRGQSAGTYEAGERLMQPGSNDSREQFASDLALMKDRAMRLGLMATGQRLDYPVRMLGFEMAGDIDGCLRYEAKLKKAEK